MPLHRPALAALTALVLTPLTVAPAHADRDHDRDRGHHGSRTVDVATLLGRATLDADFLAPGPPSGAQATPANGRTGPFAGQVVPGFSAMLDNGDGTFWAMPDNGFGAKANSADFLLRMYLLEPSFEGEGGDGTVDLPDVVSFRDPDGLAGFPIVHEDTEERLLTGADLDIESVVRLRDGSLLVGDEFGPFVLHFDADGVLLDAPVPLPGIRSPQDPFLGDAQPTLPASKGFEAMAYDGSRYAYPVLEGALTAETDQRVRRIHQLDTRTMRYTGRTWSHRTVEAANLVGDAFMTGRDTMLLLERDNLGGAQAVTKRVVEVDLGRTEPGGHLVAEPVLDLLDLANPDGIGAGDGYGTGDPFAFPFVSTETVVQLRDGSFVLANDNNYPGDDARVDGEPDDIEIVHVGLRREEVRTGGPTVFAHRGASGYRPEHTIAAYELAARQCADYVEPDLVMTRDGVLVDRHEPEIGGTTDVAGRPEFADRRTTKQVDGRPVTGWFVEDFTLAELKTLRAVERLPQLRPESRSFDGLYQVPTLDEVLAFARRTETCDDEPMGVIPEIKHSTYLADAGLPAEQALLDALARNGVRPGRTPVVIQSFEVSNLRRLDRMTQFDLVQLVDCAGAPYDQVRAGAGVTYDDLVTRSGMRRIARYADSVGLCKDRMIPRAADGSLAAPTDAIANAHRAGLTVTGWTFRRENSFLPLDFRSSADPAAAGDLAGEIRTFLAAGMDDFFTDNPDVGAAVADSWTPRKGRPAEVRFATFNASLNRAAAGDLVRDLSTPDDAQAAAVAETIQRTDPDVLLVNEFDHVEGGAAADLFRENYLEVPHNGAPAVDYPYAYVAPVNTGVPSGLDLDNNGSVGGGNDALGFGAFPGQYGMVVYSKFPIDTDAVRTFQDFLWKDMPGAKLPDDPATPAPADWYSPDELDAVRLSSKSHWDVPIRIGRETVHFLVSHPTPPVFDGPEDRNGLRNHDEIRLWADYVRDRADYLYDDEGERGGLERGSRFVIAGDQNSDPLDGDSVAGSAQQLLDNPAVNTRVTPTSRGAVEAAQRDGGVNLTHLGDPRFDTADFSEPPGNIRADYVLPDRSTRITGAGVFWPESTDPLFRLVGTFPFPASDHRLVWVDVRAGRTHRR